MEKKDKYLAALSVAAIIIASAPIAYKVAKRLHQPSPAMAQIKQSPTVPIVINKDFTDLERCTKDYIDRFGLTEFMDEYYNLVGTRKVADVTSKNAALARALGLGIPPEKIPLKIHRSDLQKVHPESKFLMDRHFLARFFADPAKVPELGEAQRLFLEWSFLAPRNYASVLQKPDRRVVVGWNASAELSGQQDFKMYTFGLIGCTGIFALAPDGSAHLSHYDEVVNGSQFCMLNDFLNRHPGADIYVTGATADRMAQHIRYETDGLNIFVHVKEQYFGLSYALCFTRSNGELEASYYQGSVSEEYLPSIHNYNYGLWFSYGRFSEIFPGDQDMFAKLTWQ